MRLITSAGEMKIYRNLDEINSVSSISVDIRLMRGAGVQQIRRNQATSLILLGVIGAEFPDEMSKVSCKDDPTVTNF